MVSSRELNILIYRYLIEAGFLHSSFVFGHESLVLEDSLFKQENPNISAGMLVNLVHKGLKFTEIEAHLNEDGSFKSCENEFSLIKPHTCVSDLASTETSNPANKHPLSNRISNYVSKKKDKDINNKEHSEKESKEPLKDTAKETSKKAPEKRKREHEDEPQQVSFKKEPLAEPLELNDDLQIQAKKLQPITK